MSKNIRVLIADDHAVVRIGLSALLATENDIAVVGEAKNGEIAVKESLRLHPDVIIMDLSMPKKDGVAATREILAAHPTARILILTTYGTSDGIAHALMAGAAGAIIKTADDDTLVLAIRKVAANQSYVSAEIRRQLAREPPVPNLSPRQAQILELMTRGLTNKEIASHFDLHLDSVEEYVSAIFAKLGASNRTEAVAIALRKHLLKI